MLASPSPILLSNFHIDYNFYVKQTAATVLQQLDSTTFMYVSIYRTCKSSSLSLYVLFAL